MFGSRWVISAFANWPGHIPSNSVVNAPLHIVDWYPTLLKLAGAKLQQKLPLDGRDAWPAITANAASPHDAILINAAPRKGALRMGDWKLVLNGGAAEGFDGEDSEAETKTEGKADDDGVELFDLVSDPSKQPEHGGNAVRGAARHAVDRDTHKPTFRAKRLTPE